MPTRNAWVSLAAWFEARGADVVLVPPEQVADLRAYYSKHTKNDRLDSRVLARLPMLHPEGLRPIDDLGPARALKRAVRRRSRLVEQRTSAGQRLDALLELLGLGYADALGTSDFGKAALAALERYPDPRKLARAHKATLTELLVKESRGSWRDEKAEELIAAAREALELWAAGGLDFEAIAADIAAEIRTLRHLETEIAAYDQRNAELYEAADPAGIVISVPGIQATLAAGILGRLDDPGLRHALSMAADSVRRVDPQLTQRYHRLVTERGLHHVSALCHLASILAVRIAACWRNGERYVLRDIDGTPITEREGRDIVADRYRIHPEQRRARRRTSKAKHMKQRTGWDKKESTKAAPVTSPPTEHPNHEANVA